jgi:hypothetical protein
MSRTQTAYCCLARAFPRDFRAVCGDGLDRLGDDLVPIVWHENGVVGIGRLFADLIFRLSVEHVSSYLHSIKEVTMEDDLFEGTWKSNAEKSRFNPEYSVEQACVRFEATDEGYLLVAYGIVNGQAVAERPTRIVADGERRPVVDLNGRPIPGVPPGAMAVGTRPDSHTIDARVEVDGKLIGAGTYHVSVDGRTLTVTNEGLGAKGPYKVSAVFDRVVPDPYVPR